MIVTIYGRDNCPFCEKAKGLARELESELYYVDMLEHGISKADLQKTVGQSVETVPQVFIDCIHIGGFEEFLAAADTTIV